MLNVPDTIKALYQRDDVQKNFRVVFPNGELPDITNENVVSESVRFTESLCSQEVLKFGLTEAPVIEFETVGVANMYGMQIKCYNEIDTSSLSAQDIADIQAMTNLDGELVLEADSDLGWGFFRIPLGVFTVDKCPRSHGRMTHRKVTAYGETTANISEQVRVSFDIAESVSSTYKSTVRVDIEELLYAAYGIKGDEQEYIAFDSDTQVLPRNVTDEKYGDQPNIKAIKTVSGQDTLLDVEIYNTYYLMPEGSSDGDYQGLGLRLEVTRKTEQDLIGRAEAVVADVKRHVGSSFNGWIVDDQVMTDSEVAEHIAAFMASTNYFVSLGSLTENVETIGDNSYSSLLFSLSLGPLEMFGAQYHIKFPSQFRVNGEKMVHSAYAGYIMPISIKEYGKDIHAFEKMDLHFDKVRSFKKNGKTQYVIKPHAIDFDELIEGWLELNAAFGTYNDGKIEAKRLDRTHAYSVSASAYSEFWWDEYNVSPIGAVTYKREDLKSDVSDDGSYVYQFGEGMSVYDMDSNKYIESLSGGITTQSVEEVIDGLFVPNVENAYFTPSDLTMKGLPYLEAGDYLEIDSGDVDEHGEPLIVGTYIMRRTMSGIQSLEDAIESSGGEIISGGYYATEVEE